MGRKAVLKFLVIAGMSPSLLRLHAYLVPNETVIAGIWYRRKSYLNASYHMTHMGGNYACNISHMIWRRSCKWVKNFNEKRVDRTQDSFVSFIFDFLINLEITVGTTLVSSISEWMSCWMRKYYENQKYYFQGFTGHPMITCQNLEKFKFTKSWIPS